MKSLFVIQISQDRKDHFAFKWEKYKGKDIIPAWVADSEFTCAPAILKALSNEIEHGVFGYTLPKQYTPANEAVVHWCKKRYGWDIDASWIVWTPGVVPAFNMACKAFCKEGDSVLVQTPNYPPLLAAPKINRLNQVTIPTIIKDERYIIDFEALEHEASKAECKLLIMCNPMNPSGSVLSSDELARIAEICQRHCVRVCSDEIHCDLILDGSQHIPAGSVTELSDNSVTLMAASKTFNVAGLGTSFAIIPDSKLRVQFSGAGAGIVPWANIMGLIATRAAFTECDDWYSSLLKYLKQNRDYLCDEINKIEGLTAVKPAATFLLWVDASGLEVDDTQKWCEDRGVGPSPGRDFGDPNHFRLNFACSFDMLQDIVQRLRG